MHLLLRHRMPEPEFCSMKHQPLVFLLDAIEFVSNNRPRQPVRMSTVDAQLMGASCLGPQRYHTVRQKFVIGDGSGVTHSLSHASASGVFVAREIAEEA